ncbi:PREDICTED: uncharacterized protein LOC102009035 isoform X2 [Chinchilla lanigera]|uniref:uncharacterized protein LOC102009035 isoform X2 n=1 Tax=Chinchilla lanigera TaxID=34839 RepID=UPI0006960E2F|nr:PREDICTED: uncharacterized protein LOC102009035 isoform X2 [Chinchilla lanigera]
MRGSFPGWGRSSLLLTFLGNYSREASLPPPEVSCPPRCVCAACVPKWSLGAAELVGALCLPGRVGPQGLFWTSWGYGRGVSSASPLLLYGVPSGDFHSLLQS